jgi:CarD family transcriptional regulator
MEVSGTSYSIGDQIVHNYYGVGKITDIVTKVLSGKECEYYRVEAINSIYFVPVNNADNDRIRPLTTDEHLEQVLSVLQADPDEMADDYKKRRKRIKSVRASGSLVPMAQLIRDMYFRRSVGKLTDAESRALDQVEERMIQEWAVCEQISPDEARLRMMEMIQGMIQQVPVGD